ncbi:SH3 domain-containing protein [Mesorhizobium sp. J428]|uniref:SH3 domain-containing protein n=1 Tax=Mesorhizobium sp. J428 TaxID=2898440 RepID=UPI002151E575|nr:SH3 domain-containing protein [Mesorhizobium sp. J428]MCR5859609.1 SH3 domain-containing protein [Mesorhizobium sp. J428]
MITTRDVAYRGNSDGEILPNGVGQGYFAMGAAFIAVGVGSAGAAVLAMSLLASDLPNPMPEQEIIQSAMAAEQAQPAPTEKPIFSDIIPASTNAVQASAAAVPMPSLPAATREAPPELVALGARDPRFAHDASAARGIEDIGDISDLEQPESAFVPMKRPSQAPFDKVEEAAPASPEKTAAIAPPPKVEEPKVEEKEPPAKAESSGKQPAGTALMIDDANIRSRPQKGSKVIGTVPARTQVQLVGCDQWCEIVVKGKRGFVWGEFVQRGRVSAKIPVSKVVAKGADSDKPDVVPASETAPPPGTNQSR